MNMSSNNSRLTASLIQPSILNKPPSRFKKQLFSSLLSISFLLVLLIILVVAQYLPSIAQPELDLRQISTSLPPPPPPPAQPKVQQHQDITIDLSTEGSGAVLPDIKVPKNIEVNKPEMPELTMDEVSFADYAPDIEIFNLNQLDGLPTLLTKAQISMPASLKTRGIKQARLRLDVTIDKNGRVTLNRIVENPYDEFKKEIQRLIRRSKFSAPKKEGAAVSARFIWPIDISV